MGLFNRGKVDRAALENELARAVQRIDRLEATVRQLELEQVNVHDQVRKWMRRAVAAERNQERAARAGELAVTPEPAAPARRLSMWGARARIAARRAQEAQRTREALPEEQPTEDTTNGVHP